MAGCPAYSLARLLRSGFKTYRIAAAPANIVEGPLYDRLEKFWFGKPDQSP